MEKNTKVACFAALLIHCVVWTCDAHTCTQAGRFPNTPDPSCQKYVLCVYDASTASYLSYNYTCPTTSVFNPNTAQCTAAGNYDCPTETTTPPTTTTSTTPPTTTTSTTPPTTTTSTTPPTTTTSTTPPTTTTSTTPPTTTTSTTPPTTTTTIRTTIPVDPL